MVEIPPGIELLQNEKVRLRVFFFLHKNSFDIVSRMFYMGYNLGLIQASATERWLKIKQKKHPKISFHKKKLE